MLPPYPLFAGCYGTISTSWAEYGNTPPLQKKDKTADNRNGEPYMTRKQSSILILLLAAGFTALCAQGRAANNAELIKTGIALYREGKYAEAAGALQLAGPVPEALYWLSLSELSAGNYNKALSHMDSLQAAEPAGRWSAELPYHRGRCFFYLGRYDEAEAIFKAYAETLPDSDPRKAASYYWQGEALFAAGRLDNAADAFSIVVENYPHSAKYEASYYRLNLITQKKIEVELLAMLKWSHEESLKIIEEYREREKQYEAAIADYQRRIGELMAAGYGAGLSGGTGALPDTEANAAGSAAVPAMESAVSKPPLSDEERARKTQELAASARELADALDKMLGEVE
jgi:tetratricopeptide (TPR) repeat protein